MSRVALGEKEVQVSAFETPKFLMDDLCHSLDCYVV